MVNLKLKVLHSVLIVCVAVGGDNLVELAAHSPLLLKGLLDNFTHFTIGVFTWAAVEDVTMKTIAKSLANLFLCGFFSSFIDVDHFLAARSLNIERAISLTQRPFLHCTTIPVVFLAVMMIYSSVKKSLNCYKLSWMLMTSFLTHHWRDAARRGLWLYPFGSTPPVPYSLYLVGLILYPICAGLSISQIPSSLTVHIQPSLGSSKSNLIQFV